MVVRNLQHFGTKERERNLVARCVQNRVERFARAVFEPDLAAAQLGDVRLDGNIAAAQANQELARDGGVGLPDPMLGARQTVVLHSPHGQAHQHFAEQSLWQQGEPRSRANHGVERLPEDVLGNDAAPRRVETTSRLATPRWLNSQAMSIALLPTPTTSTRLPCKSCGVKVSIY